MAGEIFHVDILDTTGKVFYYNMVSAVNEAVLSSIKSNLDERLITPRAWQYIQNVRMGQFVHKDGPGEFGVMAKYSGEGNIEYALAEQMRGICATVKANLAEEILQKAVEYCPVNTGLLINSFRIEDLGDGNCRIYNDCPYAWYVEEFTWKKHDYPKRAKFLTTAVYEVGKKYGLWA